MCFHARHARLYQCLTWFYSRRDEAGGGHALMRCGVGRRRAGSAQEALRCWRAAHISDAFVMQACLLPFDVRSRRSVTPAMSLLKPPVSSCLPSRHAVHEQRHYETAYFQSKGDEQERLASLKIFTLFFLNVRRYRRVSASRA